MISDKLLTARDLQSFGGSDGDFAELSRALLKQQKTVWKQLADGYKSLDTVQTRDFRFENFSLTMQWNPGRLTSSSAKTDEETISNRTCFLCPENLPAEQKGVLYGSEYLILSNPFPIFPEHFTITYGRHSPQSIIDEFDSFLNLSKDLGKFYTVFYNGPRCGASAPDHLHFQAGTRGFMPVENQLNVLQSVHGIPVFHDRDFRVTAIDDSLRRFICIDSGNRVRITSFFKTFYRIFAGQSRTDEEPMMNIIASYDLGGSRWRLMLIPRARHRPSYYFLREEEKILVSPASVDYGGTLILPRETDFLRITRDHIVRIFGEVSQSKPLFQEQVDKLSETSP